MAAFGSVIQTASTAHSGWSRCYWHSVPSSGSLSVQNVAGWSWETRADVISGPFWDDLRTVAAAMGEWTFYRNERVGSWSELRQDLRLRVQAGLDVSAPVRRLFAVKKDISAQVLGRFQRNWSDRADTKHSRLYFVPSITFGTRF